MINLINDICVFDFETSGLSPVNERVIEMAAIRVINGITVSEFRTFVKFDGVLAPKITEITGITDADLAGGMDEKQAFIALRKIMGPRSLLVAHNAQFDLAFLHYTMFRIQGITFDNPFIDTLTISRDRTPFPHKLENMCDKYAIKLEGAHRALNDVEATLELLKALHNEKPVDEWVNRLAYVPKYGKPDWIPSYAELSPVVWRSQRTVS
ncbi:3'-5' exonuclease [Paenibacillus harenae]|uniref:DNA polymerase-3 subunit epsilon/DNA polymerase-3 subunit alpha (Gram-positive type) n=1 Tax=Paenibacillus harenae TaxID=306543 RepID=A0ABT9U3U7_PAEHA|nr:3'-5' exonuclease [Paenibacillus harenae]MDQ0114317.1 DNA polymerase-3 subunit epsilon/DNA polymerase-3 subunit alpha (Gram-positive type) [Paenibacillus harenae]